jgi:hypothetical protein
MAAVLGALLASGLKLAPQQEQVRAPDRSMQKQPRRVFPAGALRPNTYPGANQRKREIPSKRKHRVRLRAFLAGRLHGRPLTAHERSWL